MTRFGIFIALLTSLLSDPALAQETPLQTEQVDALKQCLTLKSNGGDRLIFAQWLVAAMASAPQLKGVAVVNPDKRDQLDHDMAAIFTRLITVDCKDVARPVLKSKNMEGFSAAFEVFGKLSIVELTANPDASRAMGSFTKYIDDKAFESFNK